MRTDDRTKYSIASAIEVYTSEGDYEATAMVARISEASQRHVDPTLPAAARADQAFANMDLIYQMLKVIGNRQVSAERVTQIVDQLAGSLGSDKPE